MKSIQASNKVDLVGYIGIEIKALIKNVFDIKASAYYINDTIAKSIGFKGHSDFLARGSHNHVFYLNYLLAHQCIQSNMMSIFDKYDINDGLFEHYVGLRQKQTAFKEKMVSALTDTEFNDGEIGRKYLQQLKNEMKSNEINDYSPEKAKEEFYLLFKECFTAAYSIAPLSFKLHDFICVLINIINKKSLNIRKNYALPLTSQYGNASQFVILMENELYQINHKLKDITFDCISNCIDLVMSITEVCWAKDIAMVRDLYVECNKDNTNQTLSECHKHFAFRYLIKNSIDYADELFTFLSEQPINKAC